MNDHGHHVLESYFGLKYPVIVAWVFLSCLFSVDRAEIEKLLDEKMTIFREFSL